MISEEETECTKYIDLLLGHMVRRGAPEEPVPHPEDIVGDAGRAEAVLAEVSSAAHTEIFWIPLKNVF